jgi:hypothetical protein
VEVKEECKSEDESVDADIKTEDETEIKTELMDEDVKLECHYGEDVKEEYKSEDEDSNHVKSEPMMQVKLDPEYEEEAAISTKIEAQTDS